MTNDQVMRRKWFQGYFYPDSQLGFTSKYPVPSYSQRVSSLHFNLLVSLTFGLFEATILKASAKGIP